VSKVWCAGKWFEEVPDKIWKSKDGKFEIWWDRSVEKVIVRMLWSLIVKRRDCRLQDY